MSQNELTEAQYVDQPFVHVLCQVASEAMETYKISERPVSMLGQAAEMH
jgi:hypothetical protein